jgi:pyridoxine kinase
LDYGKFDILETTDYMRNTIKIWKELGFSFDAISTGFIVSEDQAKLLADFCREQSASGTVIFVDPIMADEGKLYNGMTEQNVHHFRELIKVADYIVPNYTEATLLAGVPFKSEGMTEKEGEELVDALRQLGAKSVIVTSATIDGQTAVIGYDHKLSQRFVLPFKYVPVMFPGTGDIFASVLIGSVLSDHSLKDSAQRAMDVVRELVVRNKDNVDKYKGIPIESYLEVLDK